MMLTIHGLAPNTKYQDVKILIKQLCNLDDYILDNLISEADGTKKVRIGFPDHNGGFKLMKWFNGYRMAGNFVIKVVPVSKPATNPNVPVQGKFDSRPGFQQQQQQQRPEYTNETRSDYMNQPRPNEYNRGPSGMRGPDGPQGRPGGPQGPGGQQLANKIYPQGPVDIIKPWSSNENVQWSHNTSLVPQNTFNYNAHQNVPPSFAQQQPNRTQHPYDQGREGPLPAPNYAGFAPKNNVPPRQMDSRNLRNIQIVDGGHQAPAPVHGGRYPPNQQYQQEKPIIIMKDNFQGPTQYNITHPGGHQPPYSQQENSAVWQRSHQPQQSKPQFPVEKPGYEKPFEERSYHPQEQNRDPKNLQSRQDTYKEYEKRRGFSPPGRRDDQMQRRISPPREKEGPGHRDLAGKMVDMGKRRLSPVGRMEGGNQRRMSPRRVGEVMHRGISPHGRRDDPHGRRYSPSEKRISPGDRRNMPAKRHDSPPRTLSANRRLVSPPRRDDRQAARYSPNRHHADKMGDKYGHDNKDLKKVRPAYEPATSHAQNQAMYSDGYRSDIHDNVKYSISGTRQEQPVPWQRHRDETIVKNQEDRLDTRMLSGRLMDKVDKRFSPTRKSRSPNRRDRSPIRDRYSRNSRSPRSSHSPRRSWALEKRRSPATPPPPLWPGQNHDLHRDKNPVKNEKPIWKARPFQEEGNRNIRPDDRRQYEEAKIPIAKDMERNPQASVSDHHYQREPKFSPRDTYDERRNNYHRPDSAELKPRVDDLSRRGREEGRPVDYNLRRESPSHDIRKDSKFFDKDFEDIYNRALQFKKRAEQMRKSNSKKKDEFEDNHRQSGKEREDVRQSYEDRSRYRDEGFQRLMGREDRPRDDRARDERPRDDRAREEYLRNERAHYHDDDRSRYQGHDNQQERNKSIDDNKAKHLTFTDNVVKEKRNKAIKEISEKIIERSDEYKDVQGERRCRIIEELQLAVARIVYDMFGDTDVSFIEMIIKYQARYNLKDEAKILQDVVASLPKQFRTVKRPATESSDHPTKISRHTAGADLKTESAPRPKLGDSNFNVNLAPPSVITMPCVGIPQSQGGVDQTMIPMMVSAPFYQTYDNLQQNLQTAVFVPEPVPPVTDLLQSGQYVGFSETVQPQLMFPDEDTQDGYRLYLCKDDFDRITNMEADLLKDFIIAKMFEATSESQGWAPEFTLKGLQTMHRYEVVTDHEESKNWFLSLDFSEFSYFNVLIYTKEELWYERAAIWLPGHSRVRNIEPLDKLKLQNRKVAGVNMQKWKFVKKIVNNKGTRLYVDMPPSSARSLESHNMKLSYELQQVSVFLKAVAVDKDAFDAGLKEVSLTSSAEIFEAIQNAPMPVLTIDPSLVKIVLKGSKTLDVVQARKIKEMVVYQLFKYHQNDGLNRTDFVKYGLLQPNYFAVLPMNPESKRWLMGCSFGKINRQVVVVIGGEEDNTRFIKMSVTIPLESHLREQHILERLKHSNQGVKGINFSMWKPLRIKPLERRRARFEVEIDLESVETLATMRYQLDYKDSSGMHALYFCSEYSQSGLEKLIKKYKAELTDSYDVANMDLESDQSDNEMNDVVCLD